MATIAMERKKRIGLCESVRTDYPEEYLFFEKVLKNHMWNACDEMTDMRIRKNVKYPSNDIIVVPSEKIVSLHKCFYKDKVKAQIQDERKQWISACRVAIQPQIEAYRKQAKQVCVLCSSMNKPQVDHIKHFDEIWTMFYKTNPKPELFSLPTGEKMIKDGFAEYHRQEATYRILCQSCNCKREKWNTIS